jgi:peptide-methionine (S)-S-oxide reductase
LQEGCFWCSEHVFEAVVGVDEGYFRSPGGQPKPPFTHGGYQHTGHTESIAVYYDPISFRNLVNVFFASQDPTTPNQQGPDRGSSYRSITFIERE